MQSNNVVENEVSLDMIWNCSYFLIHLSHLDDIEDF